MPSTTAKLGFVGLLVSLTGKAQPTPDAAQLLAQAKQMLGPGHKLTPDVVLRDIVPVLRQANDIWTQTEENDPRHAESLDLLAILLRSAEGATSVWRSEAAPLTTEALAIREATAGDQPSADLALALELQADATTQESERFASPFWIRATKIRGQLVAGTERAAGTRTPVVITRPDTGGPAGVVTRPELKSKVDPEYSDIARIALYACTARLSVVVNTEGLAENLTIARGCGYGLDEKAAEAVLKWRFLPGTKGDQPVRVKATVEVNFRLL